MNGPKNITTQTGNINDDLRVSDLEDGDRARNDELSLDTEELGKKRSKHKRKSLLRRMVDQSAANESPSTNSPRYSELPTCAIVEAAHTSTIVGGSTSAALAYAPITVRSDHNGELTSSDNHLTHNMHEISPDDAHLPSPCPQEEKTIPVTLTQHPNLFSSWKFVSKQEVEEGQGLESSASC